MNFVLIMIVGAAAGFLATRMMKIEADIPTTVVIGIGGAMIGGVLIRVLLEITGWMARFRRRGAGVAVPAVGLEDLYRRTLNRGQLSRFMASFSLKPLSPRWSHRV